MIHPHTELRFVNEEIGFGVFATKFIPKGTITWALDDLDQILEHSFVNTLDLERKVIVEKYSYRDSEGKYILCWDLGRYVNHSFNANCISTPYDTDIAVRDIQPGEQLTNDYGFLNLDESFTCLPEEGTDRTQVNKEDILHYYKEWDQLILNAYQFFDQVEQPLDHLIPTIYKQKMKLAAEKREVIDSIKTLYYEGRNSK
ncbi:SET domain-containing protein [Halalkalibacter flavus]|uniref:SET domain-containing protein n=1 Tax=Halalkalibacter flavus TaxID=3090668 RepID=UPI002FC6AC25